ncbi:MAG TPA: hypothetical protein VK821_10900 [Dehalococcoidia bacterium]|nr:hypothetical protein [Dehalococcoidia bacterium]
MPFPALLLGVGLLVVLLAVVGHWLLEGYVRRQPREERSSWPSHELVLLTTCKSYIDAQTVVGRLDAAGIHCASVPSGSGSWNALGGGDIRVLGKNVERAQKVLSTEGHLPRRRRR